MQITVQRNKYTSQSTEGTMYLDGAQECFTLEPRKDQSQGKPFCISAGTYNWVKGMSAHFGMVVIKLLNVPNFADIEIHPGNFPKDTHGCTIVGQTQGTDFVGHSQAEYAALMAKLPDSGTVIYIDAPQS